MLLLNINNYLKKGGVLFSKEELISHYGIGDTIMEIYNEKGELLLTKTTDNEGKILINNLPLGKYYLKEKEANFYFKITDEKVEFEIKNDEQKGKSEISRISTAPYPSYFFVATQHIPAFPERETSKSFS